MSDTRYKYEAIEVDHEAHAWIVERFADGDLSSGDEARVNGPLTDIEAINAAIKQDSWA